MKFDLRIFEFKTEIKNYTFLLNFEIFNNYKIPSYKMYLNDLFKNNC